MVTAYGELVGAVTENDEPEAVMAIVSVAEAVTAPVVSNHCTRTSTFPVAVPVKLTVAVPLEFVVPVAVLNVPLPVLVVATEKLRDWLDTALPPASLATMVIGTAVPAAKVLFVVVSVSVEPVT
jgi:hypothetical protein